MIARELADLAEPREEGHEEAGDDDDDADDQLSSQTSERFIARFYTTDSRALWFPRPRGGGTHPAIALGANLSRAHPACVRSKTGSASSQRTHQLDQEPGASWSGYSLSDPSPTPSDG